MLTLLLGTDWTTVRAEILSRTAEDVKNREGGRIVMVPELISHEMERRLSAIAGDTSSRYAEVLTFTRLSRRVSDAVGHAAVECLDAGGRVVAMASAARQLHSKLKAYASVETKPEFLTGLLDAVDEFKRCCITPTDLLAASKQTSGSLAQKMEELSLLLECYDSLCLQGKRDPRDQMNLLLEELEECSFARDHTFYVEGFPDFTRQHMAILEHLIRNSDSVTVGLNCDKPDSGNLAFEKAGATAAQLISCAKKMGIPFRIQYILPRQDALVDLREKLFQGNIKSTASDGVLNVYRAESTYQECLCAAERVVELVRNGARYRQIGIVYADSAYRNTVKMVFDRCHIPSYLSGTEPILEKSVITTVLAAMDTALDGFQQQDIFHYMRSVLSPLDMETCDLLENYAVMWGISGESWLKEWVDHPGGLGEKATQKSDCLLRKLNDARVQVIRPLSNLRLGMKNAEKLGEMVRALYDFLEEIDLAKRLDDLAAQMDAIGDNRSSQILNQLWEILLSAMEQLYDVLGHTIWDGEAFVRLFKLLLSQYDVGTIPPVLDAVLVGTPSAMRCQKVKHLIVIGAKEGNLPGYGGSSGVLSDQERTTLRQLGVPLTGGAMEGLQAEFSEIYGVFCGAETSVTVSCSGGQPSFVFRRLAELSGGEKKVDNCLGAALTDPFEAGAYLAGFRADDMAEKLCLSDEYSRVIACCDHKLGAVATDTVRKLYGETLHLSASEIDRKAQCRLAHFLQYGLRARELKEISIDPAEFGTYVHAVLEKTAASVMDRGGFKKISLEEILEIANTYSRAYAEERFRGISTERVTYLFNRNVQELAMIIEELWFELQNSEFAPVGFEVSFGKGGPIGPIPIHGAKMNGILRGFVDRVDACNIAGYNFFRVVDYKTGKKSFDYCDVSNGLGLQMLLYLFALEQEGESLLGVAPIPAGVQYFPARVPVLSADRGLTEDEVKNERISGWKRKGLLLEDETVLDAMATDITKNRLPCTWKKDGSLTGDVADSGKFRALCKFIFALLGDMVDEIASGCVDPNPYTRGSSFNSCDYCPYTAICHPDTIDGRRNYKAMSAASFWDMITKEGN